MKRRILTCLITVLLLSASVVTASAHGLEVKPPAHDEPTVAQPVSTAWAQAHCNAAAPAQATDSSDGVVTFNPDEELPCPTGPGEGAPGR